jgi:hypothetical protein
MPRAKFEEKQYETAANVEFAIGDAEVYASGQVAEALLAYDVALNTKNMAVWQLLGIAIPRGAILVPNFWSGMKHKPRAVDLPSRYVSLILQYKRPEYLTRATAAQWGFWKSRYYRIDLDTEQHLRLRRLETNLSGAAAVRYAAPAFHTREQLENHQVSITVLRNSNFASPSAIGSQHSIYSYKQGGNEGYSNREPHKIEGQSYESLIAASASVAIQETLIQHLGRVATGVLRLPERVATRILGLPGRLELFLVRGEVDHIRALYPGASKSKYNVHSAYNHLSAVPFGVARLICWSARETR